MPIKPGTAQALRELFTADSPGRAPDKDRTLLNELFGAWLDAYLADRGEHVRSSTAPFYASDNPSCARRLAYTVLDRLFPDESPGESDPPDMASYWRFFLGQTVHDALQDKAPAEWGNEVRAIKRYDGQDYISCRADMVRDGRLVVEIKSMGGYGFKMAATSFRGEPEGPKWGHVAQLALTASALVQEGHEITEGTVVLVALENLSKSWVKGDAVHEPTYPFSASYTYGIDELLALAQDLEVWFIRIMAKVEAGELPPRTLNDPELPLYAEVTNPATGDWVKRSKDGVIISTGTTWLCNYCPWQTMCVDDLDDERRQAVEEAISDGPIDKDSGAEDA